MRKNFFYPPFNFAAIDPEFSAYEGSRVVILPVPYDSTTTASAGARDGAEAIISASQNLELFDVELGREISQIGIHTLDYVEPVMSGPNLMVDRIRKVVTDLIKDGKLVVMLGGEHTLSCGAVKAFKKKYSKLSVLQLDAHADLRDSYLGTPFNHACVGRRILDEECRLVQVGVRSYSKEEADFLKGNPIPQFGPQALGSPKLIDKVIDCLSDQVYITIDMDAFDPSFVTAVGTPEPGGLQWYKTLALLKAVAEARKIVGCDIVELSPSLGNPSSSYVAAKLAYKMIGYITT